MRFGYTADEIYSIFKKYVGKIKYIDFKNIQKIILNFLETGEFKIDGLNSGEKIYKLVNECCRKKGISNISQINMSLIIPAVNILNENLYVFYSKSVKNLILPANIKYINDINIGTAVQASCSYPGVFSPCNKYKDTLLIDGGIQENIPWREVKRVGAEKVLSVVFSNTTQKKCCNSIVEVLDKSFDILCNELSKYEWNGTEYLLEIQHENRGLLNKNDLDNLYIAGYEQAKKFLKNIIL